MAQQHRRAGAVVAGLGVMVVAAAGCAAAGAGSEVSAAGPGAEVVRRAADVLLRSGSSRVRTTMETASGGTRVVIRGAGGYDYEELRGRLRVTLPEDAAGQAPQRPVTELMTPGALYMKDRGEGVPAGKWVRLDTTALPDGNLVTGGAADPLVAAELLRAARGVRPLGEEVLDGVPVRRYRGTTDIVRAAGVASSAGGGALRAAAKGFTVTEVPFDAYVDEDGRLRKLRQRFTFSNGTAENVTVTSTVVLYGFGSPVRCVLPAEGDIYHGKIVSPAAG